MPPAAIRIPRWLNAWLRPCCFGKRSLPTMPRVSAVTAGSSRVPPAAASIWAANTLTKARGGQQQQGAAQDRRAGQPDQQARPAEPVDEGAEGPAQEQG